MEKETLEEAAEKYAENKSSAKVFQEAHIIDFKAGAEYQAEKMYSEEEIYELLLKREWTVEHDENYISLDEWFEQFKKK